MSVRTLAGPLVPVAWVAVLSVATTPGRAFDAAALEGFRAFSPAWATTAQGWLRGLDHVAPYALGLVLVLAVLNPGVRAACRRSGELMGAGLPLLLAIGAGGVAALKRLLPAVPGSDHTLVENSLPSGHVYAFTAMAVLIAVACLQGSAGGRLAAVAVTAGFVSTFAVVVLVSLGHRSSDVVVSLLVVEALVRVSVSRPASSGTVGVASAWAMMLGGVLVVSSGGSLGPDGQLVASVATLGFVIAATVSVVVTVSTAVDSRRDDVHAGSAVMVT